MPLHESRKKTTEFFSKTIKSLKSLLVFHHGAGQGDHGRSTCHPFSCSKGKISGKYDACCSIKQHKKIIDEFYSDRCVMDDDNENQGYCLISTSMQMQDKLIVVSSSNNNINEQCLKMKKQQQQDAEKREMNKQGGKKSSSSCRVISQRMQELEMMEFKDVDHVLDVEEVLHYYSRLKSPVYLDIVDSFFTDMYTELLHKPQRSCLHGSKRRPLGLASVKKLQQT